MHRASTSVPDRARAPDQTAAAPALRRCIVARYASTAALGVLILPALAILGDPVDASAAYAAIAVVIACVAGFVASRAAGSVVMAFVGAVAIGVSAWLLAQASYPAAALLIAPALGVGAGLSAAAATTRAPGSRAVEGFVAPICSAVALSLIRLLDRDIAMASGAALAFVAVAISATVSIREGGARGGIARTVGATLATGVLLLLTASYIGATTPRATWFGGLVSHGPRDRQMVAITFDDGPDPPYTLQIRDILDSYGAKGTFFTVGKALDARPDVSRALLDDGQLLGNHSFHHDAVSWLDPRYGELQQTQDAFQRNLGVCPAFFRPPHGTHTPFMAHEVHKRGMEMVTWDVSAGDWATDDAQLVARRVLADVHPGSIILLHDGLDGRIGADRSVLLAALPLILDGLRDRGLQPVTLDKLLDTPAYLASC